MFEQAVFSRGPAGKRLWTTGLGMTGEAIALVLAVLVPMVSPEVLPRQALAAWLYQPPPVPPGPPPAAARVQPARTVVRPYRPLADGPLRAPAAVPRNIPILLPDEPPADTRASVVGGLGDGRAGGVPGGLLPSILSQVAEPVPYVRPAETHAAAAANIAPAKPIRLVLGGVVDPARIIHRPMPQYPPLAKTARIEGEVRLMGVIGVDGRMRELTVLSGHPLLVNAALDAVRQWIYKPTYLNGSPVEVQAPIIVTFHLN